MGYGRRCQRDPPTGGGRSTGPTREQFDAYVDPVLAKGGQADADRTRAGWAGDQTVYMEMGVGGGVRAADRERYLSSGSPAGGDVTSTRPPGSADEAQKKDHLYPLGDWAEIPGNDWREVVNQRMEEMVGSPAEASLAFEIGPSNFRQMLTAAEAGIPLIDADIAGYRAVPELSLSSFNIHGVPAQPVLFSSPWGEIMILEQIISWQRMEDIARHLAIVSGGGHRGLMAFDGKTVREKTFSGTISKARNVGRAIRAARVVGQDVTEAAARETNGYVLFRGKVQVRINEDHTAFVWGTERIQRHRRVRGPDVQDLVQERETHDLDRRPTLRDVARPGDRPRRRDRLWPVELRHHRLGLRARCHRSSGCHATHSGAPSAACASSTRGVGALPATTPRSTKQWRRSRPDPGATDANA